MDMLSGSAGSSTEEYINTSTLFGAINRAILSKNFKGGKVRNLFGSTELDFTYADITGVVTLDISQAFGEVTLVVPADWRVEEDLSHFCSVVDEDRCYNNRGYSSNKVLLLKGLSIFAVVDVVNFV